MSTQFSLGLDLGQINDYSALAIVEHVDTLPEGWTIHTWNKRLDDLRRDRQWVEPPPLTRQLHVVHLQRWALGTPYTEVVEDVVALAARPELDGSRLYVDQSGVGRPVVDLLRHAYLDGRMGNTAPYGRTITGGDKSGPAGTAKRDLIAALEIPLQQGRFKLPKKLPLGDVLRRELAGFKLRLKPTTGHAQIDIKRAGEGHGDLVIAAALACMHPDFNIRPTIKESELAELI
ncbi:MAG: hypothetical protein Q4G46_00170 [Propionibacteriaceae bacterium]|nr:hypothetical protein [Propionibacteriaceae bacterium]